MDQKGIEVGESKELAEKAKRKAPESVEVLKNIHMRWLISASFSPVMCEGRNCPRKIRVGDPYWMDTLNGMILCEVCGNCVKYSRKKALARGTDLKGIVGGV